MRWNGDSTLFAAVRHYRCIPQRITRGSNGLRTVIHTPTARPPPNADDCQASLKRLAERQRGSRAAPFARRPPVRACATSDANLRPGSRVRHALASRARRCPMDATRRLASLPRHVRDGTTRGMRARHPTRNRVYTLAAPRGIEIRIRTKQTNISLRIEKPTFWAEKWEAACRGGRVRRCGSRLGGWPERGATLARGPAPSS